MKWEKEMEWARARSYAHTHGEYWQPAQINRNTEKIQLKIQNSHAVISMHLTICLILIIYFVTKIIIAG